MRLSNFIEKNMEPILQEWEDFAKTIECPGASLDKKALRDHARQMLEAIVIDMQTKQTATEQITKSHGEGPANNEETAAETHAITRLMAGFTIEQMVSEYRALRTSVLNQWMKEIKSDSTLNADDMTRFHEAIDQALAESIARYSRTAEASRNLFLGILGHDLRTPLGAILLGADRLRRSAESDARSIKLSNQIYTSVERANQIVGDLLDLTRCQMGPGIPIKTVELELSSLCKHIIDEISLFNPEANLVFIANAPVVGRFDGARMGQVFSNIISNAVRHGGIKNPIVVELITSDGSAIFSVNNAGKPIPKEVLPLIFNPMKRFSKQLVVDKPSSEGLGLGLFIASEIVSSHKGSINVSSDWDQGTTFTVKVPIT